MFESADLVDEVWSRAQEWGTTLLALAAWLVGITFVVYLAVGAELYGLGLGIVGVGALGALVLSYPILITLERPVRITPEQAVRDYFNALSHHLPHFRRMWLLLSTAGRTSGRFATFKGFKRYWGNRLRQLRQGHAGPLAPLVFTVEEFRAEKSAGKTRLDVRFEVRILVRGRRDQGPIWTIPLAIGLVRGPDKMWYLNQGTLPNPDQAGATKLR